MKGLTLSAGSSLVEGTTSGPSIKPPLASPVRVLLFNFSALPNPNLSEIVISGSLHLSIDFLGINGSPASCVSFSF